MTSLAGVTSANGPQPKLVLSRDLADFLIAFSGAFQRYGMYPDGHPALEEAIRNLHRKLEILFLERSGVTVGATPLQLIVAGVPTDPDHSLLRELAIHLHSRGIGGLKILRGAKRSELDGLLTRIARDLSGQAPSADRPSRGRWQHIRLYPLNYAQLELVEEEDEQEAQEILAEGGDAWASRLWRGLACAALGDDSVDDAADMDPLELAIAIDVHAYDPEYDRKILASLTDFAEACRGRSRNESVAIQRHLARLLSALSPKTLQRLLAMRGDGAIQRHFLLEVTHVMAAGVVLQLVEGAAQASGHSIAPGMLQLLGKLAAHAENAPPARRPWADEAFRELVRQVVERWEGAEPGAPLPALKAAAAERAHSHSGPHTTSDAARAYAPEPERILVMSLEGGMLEPGTMRAADGMVARGQTWRLLDILQLVPPLDPVGRELRTRVFHPNTVSVLLSLAPIDVKTLDRLVPSCGPGAIAPMLDALASEKDRRIRSRLLDLLTRFGSSVGPEAVSRIKDAPWYVQRNLLKLLGTLPTLPKEFSPTACMAHPDARVRIEGLKLLLKNPSTRERALMDALRSPDTATLRLGLVAALDGCSKAGAQLIIDQLLSHSMPADLRSIGLRAIAPVQEPEVMECLWRYAVRRRWVFLTRLAPKTPDMVAALAGLSTHWRTHPRVAPVIDAGIVHRDKEVREAAGATRLLPGAPPGPKVIM